MWRIIIFAALLSVAAAGYKTPSYTYVKPLQSLRDDAAATATLTTTTTTMMPSPSPSSSALSSTTPQLTTTTLSEITSSAKPSEQPVKEEEELPPAQEVPVVPAEQIVAPSPPIEEPPPPNDVDAGKRRVITYDQRQEGQYNIRADLENFMIVFIPPSPAEGLNILDLLSKSTLRRSSSNHGSKPRRRLGYVEGSPKGANFQQSMKTGDNNQNFNYLQRQSGSLQGASAEAALQRYHHQHKHQQPHPNSALSPSTHFQDFIEGRTPYHVDISASDSESSRLQPDRQVDVLPPSYPLAYQHLIKPFHLEAEPAVLQALPPASISKNAQGANDFLETYNQLLAASSLHGDGDDDMHSTGSRAQLPQDGEFYRVSRSSRALRGDGLLESNSVTSSNSLLPVASPEVFSLYARSTHLPIFRSDLSFGAGSRYPPIDVPRLTGYINVGSNSRTLALNSAEDHDLEDGHVGEIIVPAPIEDELDLDLNSASFIDSDTKSLLSDGLERCAPGRRRDSYGVCREIEGY